LDADIAPAAGEQARTATPGKRVGGRFEVVLTALLLPADSVSLSIVFFLLCGFGALQMVILTTVIIACT
jgi:hypothetical protein